LPILTPSSGQFGESASDLLADQVNLTYQIFNLRMLLERSLTDRLLPNPGGSDHPRLQAVVGFDVSLDPPKEAKDSVAIVEVTISEDSEPNPKRVSLVALMPQEKTYNSAALNTHSNAFGGSAVARVVTVGFTQTRRGQVFYLFRDNDTLAFERMPNNPDDQTQLTFGWQFRPVLGRRSVAPGVRQMFAVLALPENDDPNNKSEFNLKVKVKTYWKHYDHGTLTTYYHEQWIHYVDPSQLPGINLRLPGLHPEEFQHVRVRSTAKFQPGLTPEVDKVEWLPTSTQSGTVVIHGKNFFTGTTITLGNQQYVTAADGLTLQSDQTMMLRTTSAAVATGDGAVNGRYGPSVLLGPSSALSRPQLVIHHHSVAGFGAEYAEMQIFVELANHANLRLRDAPAQNAMFVLYNDALLPEPTAVRPWVHGGVQGLEIDVQVPNSLLGNLDGVVTVKFAFGGRSWEAKNAMFDPLLPAIARTGGKDKATLTIAYRPPVEIGANTRVILDRSYDIGNPGSSPVGSDVAVERLTTCTLPPAPSSSREPGCFIFLLTAKTSLLDTYQKLVIANGQGNIVSVAIPQNGPVQQAAVLDKTQPTPTYLVNEATATNFRGTNLGSIKRVFFNNQDLPFSTKSDGTQITVFISADVTSKPGNKDIILQVDQNTLLPARITVLQSGGSSGNGTAATTPSQPPK